jgi:hypothetical protein
MKGMRVTTFITQWTLASSMLGHPITLDEYCDWWNENERTAYRHQAQFRELFPELETPQPIANRAIARRREKIAEKGVKGVGDVSIAGLVS